MLFLKAKWTRGLHVEYMLWKQSVLHVQFQVFIRTSQLAASGLKSVHLDLILGGYADVLQETSDVLSLISLELDHLTILGVVHNRPVTRKFLFTCSDDFLKVILRGDALNGGERLAPVTLLYPYMDVTRLGATGSFMQLICKGILGWKVLNLGLAHTEFVRCLR